MPNYFFDTYDRNISQNEPILTHIRLNHYNITLSLKSNITISICSFYETLYNVHESVKGLKM